MTDYVQRRPPVPPLSPATRVGELLILSGQIGQDLTGTLPTDVGQQTANVIDRLERVMQDAGGTIGDIARVGIYLTDIADYAAVNAVYASRFVEPYPARTAVAVAALPFGARVEMDALATLKT